MDGEKYKKGFTLAEVLITLSIIGIVAALTVPSLVKDFKETQYKIAWKKAFSMVSQAGLALAAEHGGDLAEVYPSEKRASENAITIRRDLARYLGGYLKTCNSCDQSKKICFPDHKPLNKHSGSVHGSCSGNGSGVSAILKNGMSINITDPDPACGTAPNWICFGIQIDVNGTKGPNIIGKDMFELSINRNGIVRPTGWTKTNNQILTEWSGCHSGGLGWYCSAWYLRQ